MKRSFRGITSDAFNRLLDDLTRDHLVSRDIDIDGTAVYSCHPILRDHFRVSLLARDASVATEFLDLLADIPGVEKAGSLLGTKQVMTAIELLVETGQIDEAAELFYERLMDKPFLFHCSSLFQEVNAFAQGFAERVFKYLTGSEAVPSSRRYSTPEGVWLVCCVEGANLAVEMGDFEASALFSRLLHAYRRNNISINPDREVGLLNSVVEASIIDSRALSQLGRLPEAEEKARLSVRLMKKLDELDPSVGSLCESFRALAIVLVLQGKLRKSVKSFRSSMKAQKRIIGKALEPTGQDIHDYEWCELFLRLGDTRLARSMLERSSERGTNPFKQRWHAAVCRVEGDLATAIGLLNQAEVSARCAQSYGLLPWILWEKAEILRLQRSWAEALMSVDEVLSLAVPRGMQLVLACALNTRGLILLDGTLVLVSHILKRGY